MYIIIIIIIIAFSKMKELCIEKLCNLPNNKWQS